MSTAAEILAAQLEYEVAEAKLALFRDGQLDADVLEDMMERVVARWWLKKMPGKVPPQKATDRELTDRVANRMHHLGRCVMLMIDRSGPIEANALQVSVLGLSAELNALWGLLIELGLITQEGRQDYMDAGVANTVERVNKYSQAVVPAKDIPRGRRNEN
jgi:hypothetical protein